MENTATRRGFVQGALGLAALVGAGSLVSVPWGLADEPAGTDEKGGSGMKAMRLDHVHIKAADEKDFRTICDTLQLITGHPLNLEMEFGEMGMKVGYDPHPYCYEVMQVIDNTKELARYYEEFEGAVFCLTYRVEDYEQAAAEMEELGFPQLMRYDSPPYVKEGFFDTLAKLPFYIELIESPDSFDDVSTEDFDLSGTAGA